MTARKWGNSQDANGLKLTNVGAPTPGSNDVARIIDVESALAAVASGQTLKGSVKVAVTGGNVNIASPGGTSIDGVTVTNGDVLLLTTQTTGSQNGPWVFNGPSSAMTRPTNWDTAGEAVVGSYWVVQQGPQADKFALMTNDTFTLGTDTAAFAFIGVAAGGGGGTVTGYTTVCPAVSAGGTWTVNHALGSTKVIVQVYRVASPYDEVDVYIARVDANNVAVQPDIAFTSGEYEVMVLKVA